jgi:hypothetical protein
MPTTADNQINGGRGGGKEAQGEEGFKDHQLDDELQQEVFRIFWFKYSLG